jgi:cobalt-zinc-cadmium efflux system outer membrane protein
MIGPLLLVTALAATIVTASSPAFAQAVTYDQALATARTAAPDLAVARSRERIAAGEIDVAGIYPNPSVSIGTSTQTARLSAGVSIPLVILGQRGAAMQASRAELETARVDTQATWNDVRTATAKAFVDLWLAQQTAAARADGAAVATRIETAVKYLVENGKSPQTDALRVHAERLRADADAQEAAGLVDVAASELARWMGAAQTQSLRAAGDPADPQDPPALASFLGRVDASPAVRRELADAAAAEARANRERAAVRPLLTLDLGVDAWDNTLLAPGEAGPPPNNYRAAISVEVPILNQRGPLIDRERIAADAARTRAQAEHTRELTALLSAYRTLVAVSARAKALEQGVVPAAEEAARRTEEAHVLGYAPLFAVLDAEKARIDAKVQMLNAKAARAAAWEDVLHAIGGPS